MKKCTLCGTEKPVTEFYKNKTISDGRANQCKLCVKKRSSKRFNKKKHDKDFFISKMYQAQKERSKIRGHKPPSYTKQQFEEWLKESDFDRVFSDWEADGFDKMSAPSVDRIDNLIGYTMENIQLVTWRINLDNATTYLKNNGKCKPLLRISSSGESVTEYVSMSAAVRDMGYKVEYQIKNGVKCRNGFYWKYK